MTFYCYISSAWSWSGTQCLISICTWLLNPNTTPTPNPKPTGDLRGNNLVGVRIWHNTRTQFQPRGKPIVPALFFPTSLSVYIRKPCKHFNLAYSENKASFVKLDWQLFDMTCLKFSKIHILLKYFLLEIKYWFKILHVIIFMRAVSLNCWNYPLM